MDILVKSFVIDDDGNTRDIVEGNMSIESANTLQVGESISLTRVQAKTINVTDQVSNSQPESYPRGKYKIMTREELQSEVNTPYIKLTMKRIF